MGSSKTIGKIKLINITKIARIYLNKTLAFIIGINLLLEIIAELWEEEK